MAGSITPASNELSAELLLNKIMNNQVKTSTGKTVTAANRTMSSKLASSGYAAGAAAGAVSSGEGYVLAAQGQVTEMVAKLKEMQKLVGGVVGTTSAYKQVGLQAGNMMTYIGGIQTSKVDGKVLLSGAGMVLNAGMGATIKILGQEVGTGAGKLAALATLVGVATITNAANAADAMTAIDEAIAELNGYIADYGTAYNRLQDRSVVLNNMAEGFDESAGKQSISDVRGASGLLGNMLGE